MEVNIMKKMTTTRVLCVSVLQLRSRLSADETLVEKLATRRNKPSVMGDSGGTSLPRKGDHLANQDTCLTALRGDVSLLSYLSCL